MEVLTAAFLLHLHGIYCFFYSYGVGPSRPKILHPHVESQGLIIPEEKEISNLRFEVMCVCVYQDIFRVLTCNYL